MKTKMKSTLLVASLILVAAACDDESNATTVMTNDEAAELIAVSLAESSSGLTVTVDETVTVTETAVDANSGGRIAACGYTEDFNFNTTNPQGSLITYNYAYGYSYVLSCGTNQLPASMSAEVTYSGEFDAPRLASAHSGDGELTVTNLDSTAANYAIDGYYNREGSFESKISNLNSGNHSLILTIDNLIVNKSDKEIVSGSASIELTGVVTTKGNYSFTASIVFNGDGTATVTVKGDAYSVDLSTGVVTSL